MRKKLKQLMGILLSLALVLGMMPGMSLTAYADDDNPYASLKNKTTEINFDGKKWYLIGYDNETVTLLSKECVGASAFGSNSTYRDSTIETFVKNWYTKEITADAKTVVNGGGMFLLSTDEANDLSADVRKCQQASGAETNYWWLRSPGDYDDFAACVNGYYGRVDDYGRSVTIAFGVRPALKLNLSSVIFSSNTFELKPAATEYPLWVGGTQVTSENASNIDGNNKASYNAETKTLTLNGYNNNDSVYSWTNAGEQSCSAAIYAEEDLIIELSGTNTVNNIDTGMGDYGIYALNALTIKGSGQLNTEGGYGIYAFKTLDINSGVINATSTAENGAGISIWKGLNVTGGTVTATGEFQGINSQKNITINGGTVTATGGHDGIFVASSYVSTISMTVEGGTVDATGGTSGIKAGDLTIKNGSSVTATCNDDSYCFAIIGKGSNATSAGYVNNEIAGTGWTNKDGTEGRTTIVANSSQDLTPYKKVQFPATHEHDFTYTLSADGTTITATCSAAGCTLDDGQGNHTATLTIVEPTLTTYGGTDSAAATFTGLEAFKTATGKNVAETDIKYVGREGTTYDSTTAPVNAGKYSAQITLGGVKTGEGADKSVTASVDYEITKATPLANNFNYSAPSSDLTYDGNSKTATVVPKEGITGMGRMTVKYYSDAECSTGNEVDSPTNVGDYYVGIEVAEGTNYSATSTVLHSVGWSFTINKADQTAPDAPTIDSATVNSITLTAIENGEYKCGDGDWQTSPTFNGLTMNTMYTFYQRYAADGNHNVSDSSEGADISTSRHSPAPK